MPDHRDNACEESAAVSANETVELTALTDLTELARSLLRAARERSSLKFIYQLAAATGNTLKSQPETLRKFVQEDNRGLDNRDDLLRVVTIFTINPIGAALVQPINSKTSPISEPVSDSTIRNRFFSEMLKPAAPSALKFSSRYLVYHSSFFETDCYAIRFLAMYENPITKQISFKDTKLDRGPIRAMEGSTHFINYGVVRFFMGKPHFASIDTSSDVGGRLIVIDRWVIDKGYAQTLVGRMSGMSNMGQSYVKDVLLRRWDGTDDRGLGQTGNFPRDSLSATQRARFADLAKMRPKNDLPDKTLDSVFDS